MKKRRLILIGSVLLLVSVLSGCDEKHSSTNMPEKKTISTREKKEEKVGDNLWDQVRLQAALQAGKKIKCTMIIPGDSEEKSAQTEFYFDGEKYRSMMDVNGKKNYTIFDGKTFYNWQDSQAKGTKMDKECLDKLQEETIKLPTEEENMEEPKTVDKILEDNKAAKFNCQEVDQIDLSLPANVEFIDQCEMLNKIKEQAEKLQESF